MRHFRTFALVLALAGPSEAWGQTLLVWATGNSSGDTSALADSIEAGGGFTAVDVDERMNVPLVDLLPYDTVFFFSNANTGSDSANGDVLADFVDAGGGLVLAPYVWANQGANTLSGRLVADGLTPFQAVGVAPNNGATLGWTDGSTLWSSVTTLQAGYRNQVVLAPGASLLGLWSDSIPLLASKGRVLGLNLFPDPSIQSLTGDWLALIGNTLSFITCAEGDDDGDGWGDGGGACVADCDDTDPTIHPYAPEICDFTDTDCDLDLLDGFTDTDADAEANCTDDDDDDDGTPDLFDCGTTDPSVFPGAAEACDDIDQDCDGSATDGQDDLDGDGSPDCTDPDDDGDGFPDAEDCGPQNAAAHPGAFESCDAVDQDCDGSSLDGYVDGDGDFVPDCVDEDDDDDGSPDHLDCAPSEPAVRPGAFEACDGLDSNCDGQPEGDSDLDGTRDCDDSDDDGDGDPDTDDCAPLDAAVGAGADESCDGADNNCDGDVDEGHPDSDGDLLPDCVDDAPADGPTGDLDNDGVTNAEEVVQGTDPTDDDSDGDGLLDGEEGALATDPTNEDTDGDHVEDGDEFDAGTDPGLPDSDADGLDDGVELWLTGTDPLDPDTDDDGMLDGEEALRDSDGDGVADPLDPDPATDPGGCAHAPAGPVPTGPALALLWILMGCRKREMAR